MFFFKKRNKNSDFSAVGVDMHSHLVPGVDDGAKDVSDSLKLITGLKELGFSRLITTPHTLQDIHPNTTTSLQQGFSLLDGKLPDTVLPLPGNRLLFEFSQIARPHDLEEQIFELGIKGYQLILAHPERYLFFHKQFSYYTRLKEMGVELQVNALSLTEHYGKNIKQIAEKLIEKDMIDFIGTDTHHVKHLETLKLVPQSKHFARLLDSGLLKNSSFN